MKYDRQLLLHGTKRNEFLELAEVHAYGQDSYDDPDYLCIYGLRPADWYAKGIRLLGRTAVECTRDGFADLIGRDAAAVAGRWNSPHRPLLIDPFAGSGNTLYWLARHLAVEEVIGFELDPSVFELTKSNLGALHLPIELRSSDYQSALKTVSPAAGQLVVAFVAPPWGDALDPVAGLDLRRTYPPITQIAEHFAQEFKGSPLLLVIQVHETVSEDSVRDLTTRFDWHELKNYDLLAPGSNHGILIAASRWNPPATAV
jgi:hypothetical protein